MGSMLPEANGRAHNPTTENHVHNDDTTKFPADISACVALLSDDYRPSLVLRQATPPLIEYRNAAFLSFVSTTSGDTKSLEHWINGLLPKLNASTFIQGAVSADTFGGRSWTVKSVGNSGWAVVYATTDTMTENGSLDSRGPPPDQSTARELPTSQNGKRKHEDEHETQGSDIMPEITAIPAGSYSSLVKDKTGPISSLPADWLRLDYTPADPYIQWFKKHAWENTTIGPINTWPPQLCSMVSIIMSCPHPRTLLWGDQYIVFMNETAMPICGQVAEISLGNALQPIWGQAMFDYIDGHVREHAANGRSTEGTMTEYIIYRHGYPEEAFFDATYLPAPGDNGNIAGAIVEFVEVTSTVMQERRNRIISRALELVAGASTIDTLWSSLVKLVEEQLEYISYTAIYTADDGHDDNFKNGDDSKWQGKLQFKGCGGVQAGQVPAIVRLDDRSSHQSLADTLSTALTSNSLSVLTKQEGTLCSELAIDLPIRGRTRTACVLPIKRAGNGSSTVVIFGLNPRRPFDEEDRVCIDQIHDLLQRAVSILSPSSSSNTAQERDMALLELSEKLRVTKLEAKLNEERYSRMARNAPFGMFLSAADGTPLYINDAFLHLTGVESFEKYVELSKTGRAWREMFYEEDFLHAEEVFANVVQARTPMKYELRFKIPEHKRSQTNPQAYRWVETTAFTEVDEHENVIGIHGWHMDISDRKISEDLMARRLQDALETKRASENFIDMVSHEIRNPLSAILQLADSITSSLKMKDGQLAIDAIDTITDAARTITLCAQHQKNIVDDVLVMSKLDSNLLVISPEKCQPSELIKQALKMFEAELHQHDIEGCLQIDQSFYDLNVDCVLLDQRRLLQVMINLLTNAIKFTQFSETRKITIAMAACSEPPTGTACGLVYAAPRRNRSDTDANHSRTSSLEPPSNQDTVYVQFAVIDTGRGLSEDERDRLFQRFHQASPKTHKKYGGSGLGLFISKELTELQGGRIGVRSDGTGTGCTFGFYVSAQRCDCNYVTTPLVESPLPLASKAKEQADSNATPVQSTQACCRPMLRIPITDMHVLIVEDNAINQKVMAQQLRRVGATVHVADNGVEALKFLKNTRLIRGAAQDSQNLSMVLMDVEMPVMDGLTCTREIRNRQNSGEFVRYVPIIAITANARSEQIASALNAGVDEVVTKPFRIPDLVPRMEALASKHLPPNQ